MAKARLIAIGLLTVLPVVMLAGVVCVGCATGGAGSPSGNSAKTPAVMTETQMHQARAEFEKLRRRYAPQAGTMRVSVAFSAPRGIGKVKGRGAVARRPPDSLRMILLGPGGVTALDLLVRGAYWRVVIPAKQHKLEGSEGTSEPKGLPVGFLRWWFLRPLDGQLVSAFEDARGTVYVVRDGDAKMLVQQRSDGLVVQRESSGGTERMLVKGPGCSDAVYEHEQSAVRVDVHCEAVVADAVQDRMFE